MQFQKFNSLALCITIIILPYKLAERRTRRIFMAEGMYWLVGTCLIGPSLTFPFLVRLITIMTLYSLQHFFWQPGFLTMYMCETCAIGKIIMMIIKKFSSIRSVCSQKKSWKNSSSFTLQLVFLLLLMINRLVDGWNETELFSSLIH